jgi:epoxyqueuosine reductase
MDNADILKNRLCEWGASAVGFSDLAGCLPPELERLRYGVTVAVRLSDFIIDEITDRPTYTYFHHYRTVNALIDQITLRAMLFIQEAGGRALAVPASQTVNDRPDGYSGIFPHKTAAVRAGLGWIGKSGLFISSAYGPRVRLGTVLTDMPLPAVKADPVQGCGSCRACVDSCPALAIAGNCWEKDCERSRLVDARACSEYMNAKFKHIGRGSVCGICMKVCPK